MPAGVVSPEIYSHIIRNVQSVWRERQQRGVLQSHEVMRGNRAWQCVTSDTIVYFVESDVKGGGHVNIFVNSRLSGN